MGVHCYETFKEALRELEKNMRGAVPRLKKLELLHESFSVLLSNPTLDYYREQLRPTLPWADIHFEERVCGWPLNPGKHAPSGHYPMDVDGKFNYTYAERYWPRLATTPESSKNVNEFMDIIRYASKSPKELQGIKYPYGDLEGVIELLAENPSTTEAYLPVWFPEDTGVSHSGKKPDTLGYQFIVRNNQIDITYYTRSCDFDSCLSNNIYMTLRLLNYVLCEIKDINSQFKDLKMGVFTMHITSLYSRRK